MAGPLEGIRVVDREGPCSSATRTAIRSKTICRIMPAHLASIDTEDAAGTLKLTVFE